MHVHVFDNNGVHRIPGKVKQSDHDDVMKNTSTKNVRTCSQAERSRHIREMCPRIKASVEPSLLTPARRTLVDEVHKILYCFMSKVGCTAFKTLLAKANSHALDKKHVIPNNYGEELKIHESSRLGSVRIVSLHKFNQSGQEHRVDKYFKFMVMRHPFERLISAWRDKVLHPSDYPGWSSEILLNSHHKLQRHWLPAKLFWRVVGLERYYGKPRFDEFLQWIIDNGIYNEHWRTAMDSGHVCAHDWDAILRIETMDSDRDVILDRLKMDLPAEDGKFDVVHSRQNNRTYNFPSMTLPMWQNISEHIEHYFLNLYRRDMEIFGYKWDSSTKTTISRIETPNGPCC